MNTTEMVEKIQIEFRSKHIPMELAHVFFHFQLHFQEIKWKSVKKLISWE